LTGQRWREAGEKVPSSVTGWTDGQAKMTWNFLHRPTGFDGMDSSGDGWVPERALSGDSRGGWGGGGGAAGMGGGAPADRRRGLSPGLFRDTLGRPRSFGQTPDSDERPEDGAGEGGGSAPGSFARRHRTSPTSSQPGDQPQALPDLGDFGRLREVPGRRPKGPRVGPAWSLAAGGGRGRSLGGGVLFPAVKVGRGGG